MAKKGVFKALFGRKEGGSVVGNLLRGVGDKFTGGIYSKVFQPGAKGLFGAGKVKSSGDAPAAASNPFSFTPSAAGIVAGDQPQSASIMDKFRKNWAYLVGGASAVALLIWYVTKGKSKGGYRRR